MDRLSPGAKRWTGLVAVLVSAGFCLLLAYMAVTPEFRYIASGQLTLNTQSPLWLVYSAVPVAALMLGGRYIAEAVVVATRFAFEQVHLHRLEICIVPRNANSRRVMDKLRFRNEGIAERYLEINGTWEDHLRYAITAEEWAMRGDELTTAWITG